MDITLLEIRLPNAQFNAPFSGAREDETEDEADRKVLAAEDGSSDLRPLVAALVIVGFAVVAYLRRERDEIEEVPA